MLVRASELIEWAMDAQARIERLPRIPAGTLEHYGGVLNCVTNFGVIGNLSMRQFMQPYDELARQSLVMMSYMLDREDPDPHPSREALEELRRKIDDLIDEVTGSTDLPREFRDL